MIKQPMLAETLEEDTKIIYPVYASSKLDGIRCVTQYGEALSRSMKLIRNNFIRNTIQSNCPDNLDGEIITLTNGKVDDYNTVQSKVMSFDGTPDFQYVIFDFISSDMFDHRYFLYSELELPNFCVKLKQTLIHSDEELKDFEENALETGFEGVMLRKVNGLYKQGRSTLKQFYLIKVKRFADDEAEIIGFEEKLINDNEAFTDITGYTKRSKEKAGMIKAGTLGALVVKDLKTGLEFTVGSGLNDSQRKEIWENQETYIGMIITYKHFKFGAKDKPRFPIFKGFRHQDDM